MRTHLLLISLVALTGCNTKLRVVEVPVPIACVKSVPALPVSYYSLLDADAGIADKVEALVLDHISFKAALQVQYLKLKGCEVI